MNVRPSDNYRKMRERAVKAFEQGKSQRSIAMNFGVGTATVGRWYAAWRAGKSIGDPVFSKSDDDRLRAMYLEYSRSEIAEALGKTVNSVRHRARILGLTRDAWTPKKLKEQRVTNPAPGVTVHRLLG